MVFPFTAIRQSVGRLAEAVLKRADPTARAKLEAATFGTADDEELDGRRLYGTNQLEFTDAQRDRALWLSRRLFYRSGVHGGLTEMFAATVIGDGVVIRHKDESADRFLQDVLAQNRFHERLADLTDRWFVDGELPWSILIPNRGTSGGQRIPAGRALSLGRIDPFDIADVKVAVLDRDRVVSLRVQPKDDPMLAARMPDDVPVAEVGTPPRVLPDGSMAAVCLWRINPLGVRGAPLLLRILDKADALDRVVKGIADRQEVAGEFAWIGHYDAAKPDEAAERKILAFLTARRAGKSMVWPMKGGKKALEVEAAAPALSQADAREAYECVLDYVLGSASVPRMWFGSGGDTNRATAVEQGSPIHRRIKKIAAQFREHLRQLCAYVVYVGQLSSDVPQTVNPSDIEVTTPDVATRDSVRDVQEVTEMSLMARDLVEHRAITRDEGRKMLRRAAMAKPFGEVLDGEDVPPDDELTGPRGVVAGSPSVDDVDADPATGRGMAAGSPYTGGPTPTAGEGAPVASMALNGGQIQAAADIVQSVVDGKLPEESAIELMLLAFPTWTREHAIALLRPAAEFEPAASEPKALQPPVAPAPAEPAAPAASEAPRDPPSPGE